MNKRKMQDKILPFRCWWWIIPIGFGTSEKPVNTGLYTRYKLRPV